MSVKLGDLGAARFIDASLSVEPLSPEYTTPERMDGRSPSKSKEMDVYSLGVTLMELFTGQKPASHPRHRDRQVHLIEQREVRLTCMKMLHSQPSQRLTVSQALPEMVNICETVEYSDGVLRVTDGRTGAHVAVGVVVGVDVVVGSRACRCIGVGVQWWCCLQAAVVEVLVPVPVHGLVQFLCLCSCWGCCCCGCCCCGCQYCCC